MTVKLIQIEDSYLDSYAHHPHIFLTFQDENTEVDKLYILSS